MNTKLNALRIVSSGLIAAIAVLPFFSATQSVAGEKQGFTLHNQTGKTIKEIYVGPSNSDRFGEDVLGQVPVRAGGSFQVRFHSAAPGNHWDLRIVLDDDTSKTWTNLDLSTIDDMTISDQGGKLSAMWKQNDS